MKKTLFTILVCFAILISTPSGFADASSKFADASNKPVTLTEEEILDAELEELGFPIEYISIMSLEQKQDIIDSNPVGFGGYEKVDYTLDENGELKEINTNTDEISIMATIPATSLTLWNGKSDLGYINGRKTYRVYVNWEWKKEVFFAYKDKVALSYNSEFQTRVSNNGNYSCRSTAWSTQSTWTKTSDCYGRPSEITFGGASWYYDISYGGQIRNKGYAQMDIETKSTSKPTGKTGILLSKYYHKKGAPGSLSLSIGYASIGLSSGSNYDEAAAQHSWNY